MTMANTSGTVALRLTVRSNDYLLNERPSIPITSSTIDPSRF
jgi:hypothetical protein